MKFWFWLLNYLKLYRLKLILTALLVLGSTALSLAPPWLIREGIDEYILAGRVDRLLWLALLMVLLALLRGVLDLGKRYQAELVAQKVVHDIRRDLFNHISRLSFSFFDSSRTGDLLSRITSDTDDVRRLISFVSINLIGNFLLLLGILLVLLLWEIRLALLYLLFFPVMIQAMRVYARRVRPVFARSRKQLAGLTEKVRENLLGMETVKTHGALDWSRSRVQQASGSYRDTSIEAAGITARWMPYVNFLTGVFSALLLWYGGRLVVQEIVTLGELSGFFAYLALLFRPIRQSGMMVNLASRALASGRRLLEVMEEKPQVSDRPDACPLSSVEGRITYENVSFAYEKDRPVLRDITLQVEPGQTAALVGPSGAGKSTLLKLLPRFYEPQQGKIYVDGQDIEKVTADSLRDNIGVLFQHTFLFSASVAENIASGSPQASMEEIREAAARAQIAEFIESLPLGYDTPVGERGVSLSGGQRQRLALARMLLTDPRGLLLDEPASQLDEDTEKKLRRALHEVSRDRTSLIISHRLWTVNEADMIFVLDQGEIKERGEHEELLEQGGLYSRLYNQIVREGGVVS